MLTKTIIENRYDFFGDNYTTEYYFDALNRRVAKELTIDGNTFNQSFAYLADQNKILLARNGDGEETLYIDGQGINERLARINSTEVKPFVTDHLGSVLNDEIGGENQIIGAHGTYLGSTPIPITSSSQSVHYGFTGHEHDTENGKIHAKERDLIAGMGIFLQPDPIWPEDHMNPYVYTRNSPVMYVDPYGEMTAAELFGSFFVATAVVLKVAILMQAADDMSRHTVLPEKKPYLDGSHMMSRELPEKSPLEKLLNQTTVDSKQSCP